MPGRSLRWSRKRKPIWCSFERTINSGLVFVKVDPNTGLESKNSNGILEPFIIGTEPYNLNKVKKLDNLSSINNDFISGTGSLLLK